MAVEKGSAFLLKVGNGDTPLTYSTIAGLRTTQLSVSGEAVNITSKDSGGWRELLSGAGVRAVNVSAAGIFTGSAGEVRPDARAIKALMEKFPDE
jgi:TP901-1 family phage major tail protein